MEDVLYESESMCRFTGLGLIGPIPNETAILNFRHLKEGKRDPEMHQTKKGNQWYFGMKMHIGVDKTLGVIHSMETTAANVHDITQTEHLLHGKEVTCYGDAGYLGVEA